MTVAPRSVGSRYAWMAALLVAGCVDLLSMGCADHDSAGGVLDSSAGTLPVEAARNDAGAAQAPGSLADAGSTATQDAAFPALDSGVPAGPALQPDASGLPAADAGPGETGEAGPAASGSPEAGALDGGSSAASSADKTLIPHASWTCAMPDGIPPPELGTLAFTADFAVRAQHDMGTTQYGKRRVLEFGSGSFSGPALNASLDKGGFELLLVREGGVVELEQVLVLKSSSGAPIYLRVCGVAPQEGEPVRVVMDIEAPNASFAKLNKLALVGVRQLSADGSTLMLKVYDVSSVQAPADSVRIEKTGGAPAQSWDCVTASGQKGAEVYRETVNIGGSVMVGASKRGTRNIIPITGGTTTGRLKGSVLPLGADFQLLGATFIIDARYIVKTQDDELIIVRNCGPVGALVPVFEARADGPYAWINENRFLSSDPGLGQGSVNLTIYEIR